MTPAQEQALAQVNELLHEHFPASLVVVEADNEAGDPDRESEIAYEYHGGYFSAIGMARYVEQKIIAEMTKKVKEDEG